MKRQDKARLNRALLCSLRYFRLVCSVKLDFWNARTELLMFCQHAMRGNPQSWRQCKVLAAF